MDARKLAPLMLSRWLKFRMVSQTQFCGRLDRVEAKKIVVGYSFDLKTNTMTSTTIPNPSSGLVHAFIAYRLVHDSDNPVAINPASPAGVEAENEV